MMKKSIIFIGLFFSCSFMNGVLADDKPLLQEGKKTLYQRILTTPNCNLYAKEGDEASKIKVLSPFTRFYVYEHKKIGNNEWLAVATNTKGKDKNWLKTDCTIPWNMQMALTINNRAGLDRGKILFFKDAKELENIVNLDDAARKAKVQEIREALKTQKTYPTIVAEEPEEYIDYKKHFYLLPILNHKEDMLESGQYKRFIEVASVTQPSTATKTKTKTKTEATGQAENKNNNTKQDSNNSTISGFNVAVVFLIDTTISMDPYIQKTKDIVAKMYKQIGSNELGENIKFGLVAYRSSLKPNPKLEYLTKVYVDPNAVKDGEDFLQKVKDLKQATASSPYIKEDTYAGIMDTLNQIDWNKFGARYIIHITDSSAIEGADTLSSTKLDAEQVSAEAAHKGVAIYSLHLQTPFSHEQNDVERAKKQYEKMTFNTLINKSLYYPIENGDVNLFGKQADKLAKALTEQANLAYEGKTAVGSASTAKVADNKKDDLVESDAAKLGRAMRLAYLGRDKGVKAPDFFKAWIVDEDLANLQVTAAEPRILVTKKELSDLYERVSKILEASVTGLTKPDEMFKKLKSMAADMAQDPSRIKNDGNLYDIGIMSELIESLPYKSKLMSLDQDAWRNLQIQGQEELIRELEAKLAYYKYCNEDVSRWIALDDDADADERVYPLRIDQMP